MSADRFRRYAVPAPSVRDFLERFYKPERFHGRGAAYAEGLIRSYEDEVREQGYTFISRHDCVSGELVAWYPQAEGART